jgi:oligopeptide/dipeptide ABC transporter ATP-binding protein
VDGVSFSEAEGETLGLVDESGSGKSMTCLSLVRLHPRPAARILGGQVLLDGEDLLAKSEPEMERIRGRKVAMILQDPMSSLNPVFSIGMQVREPVAMYHGLRGRPLTERAAELLAAVRIPSPALRLRAFPHQLSGGMRQRVMVAMALINSPALLIADEPTTALDVTIQAQILDLMREMIRTRDTGVILITHDLGVVAEMADRVAVMYAGRIVEQGSASALFDKPLHPYTQGLAASVPVLGQVKDRLETIPGVVPDLIDLPPGCRFAPRCPARERFGLQICTEKEPDLIDARPGHAVRCWLYQSSENHRAPLAA